MSAQELKALKDRSGLEISVVLPALNEARTIAGICSTVRRLISAGAVDELLVIDSGSNDETVERAARAGAVVHRAADLTDAGAVRGKGDCLWRSLTVVSGDIVVWLDSDTQNFDEHFVIDLVAPLLTDEQIVLTKAFYERPLASDDGHLRPGGARLTELVARPMLALLYPELAGIIQPLSGEYAARVDALRDIPFFTGYGVEIGILVDIAERFGVERIAQVDLGTRVHTNRSLDQLGRASMQVMTALFRRMDELGRIKLAEPLPTHLTQYVRSDAAPERVVTDNEIVERPPISQL